MAILTPKSPSMNQMPMHRNAAPHWNLTKMTMNLMVTMRRLTVEVTMMTMMMLKILLVVIIMAMMVCGSPSTIRPVRLTIMHTAVTNCTHPCPHHHKKSSTHGEDAYVMFHKGGT